MTIFFKVKHRQNVKKEEELTPNPLYEVVSWQLLASLGRVLLCQESSTNSYRIDSNAVGLDSQLLQLCNRFGIPCQLVELSNLEEGGKAPVSFQVSAEFLLSTPILQSLFR